MASKSAMIAWTTSSRNFDSRTSRTRSAALIKLRDRVSISPLVRARKCEEYETRKNTFSAVLCPRDCEAFNRRFFFLCAYKGVKNLEWQRRTAARHGDKLKTTENNDKTSSGGGGGSMCWCVLVWITTMTVICIRDKNWILQQNYNGFAITLRKLEQEYVRYSGSMWWGLFRVVTREHTWKISIWRRCYAATKKLGARELSLLFSSKMHL